MNGREFIRKVKRLGAKRDVIVSVDSSRGKGSHRRLTYGSRWTTVKHSEIGPALLNAMCKQIGIDPGDL